MHCVFVDYPCFFCRDSEVQKYKISIYDLQCTMNNFYSIFVEFVKPWQSVRFRAGEGVPDFPATNTAGSIFRMRKIGTFAKFFQMTEQETLKRTLEPLLLLGKGQLRIPQIARKLSITERTAYCGLGTLRECGFVVEKDKGGCRIAGLLPENSRMAKKNSQMAKFCTFAFCHTDRLFERLIATF